MKKLPAILLFLSFPFTAGAHAVGDVYRLPVPLSYYLIGAGLTVAISFLALGLFMKRPNHLPKECRFSLPWLPWMVRISRGLNVFFLFLMIAAGIFGPFSAFAPLAFWIYFLIGFGILSICIGNVWERINPWKAIADWIGLTAISPSRFSVNYAGVFLLLGLFWFELASGVASRPAVIGIALLGYTLFSLIMAALVKDWFQNGELFSVLYGFIGKLAYLRISDDNRALIAAKPWMAFGQAGSWATVGIAGVLLAGTSFDSVKESQLWFDGIRYLGLPLRYGNLLYGAIPETIGILLAPLPFITTYLLAISIMKLLVGNGFGNFSELSRKFIWSLIPIGFGYTLAHNFALFISSLPAMYIALLDPFAMGWGFFGAVESQQVSFVPSAKLVWFAEIGFIVLAHIIGLWLAHRIALLIFKDERIALKSQYPMTLLMVGYTALTLWLLAQPLVSFNPNAPVFPSQNASLPPPPSQDAETPVSEPPVFPNPPLLRR